MFQVGKVYNVISKRGIYAVVFKVHNDKDIQLLTRISLIARVEEIQPLVRFAYESVRALVVAGSHSSR